MLPERPAGRSTIVTWRIPPTAAFRGLAACQSSRRAPTIVVDYLLPDGRGHVLATIAEGDPPSAVLPHASRPRPRRRDPVSSDMRKRGCCPIAACPIKRAAAAARRAFGNVALAKEETRAVWLSTRLEQLLQDLRFGCRILTKSPAVSLTATILIALVIGGNTTVFSIAHSVLSKPSPGVHAARLTTVSWVAENGEIETHAGFPVYSHFLEHSTAFQPIAAFDFARLTLALDSGSYAVRAGIVSPNYFETLGVRLVKGRSFLADAAAPAHVGARRDPRSPCVAELLRRRREHRRAGGQLERRAGNGRRSGGGGFSRCVLCRTGRRLGAARWGRARHAADQSWECGGHDRPANRFAFRGAGADRDPLDAATTHPSGGEPAFQGQARAVLGDRRRQQPCGDARQPDARDLLGGHGADDRDRVRQRHEPPDRARGRPAEGDGGPPVARRFARPDRPQPARRGPGLVRRRLGCGLSVRVVGVRSRRAVPRAGNGGAAGDAGSHTRLDGGRLCAPPRAALHRRCDRRTGASHAKSTAASIPQGGRAGSRPGTVSADPWAGRAAAGAVDPVADERRTRSPIAVASGQPRRRVRHQTHTSRDRQHGGWCYQARHQRCAHGDVAQSAREATRRRARLIRAGAPSGELGRFASPQRAAW